MLLSSFNLRRYIAVDASSAYISSLYLVGRCRLTLSNPSLSRLKLSP